SIHLEDWPVADDSYMNESLEDEMATIRVVAEKAHAVRKEQKIKVRQPLAKVTVVGGRLPSIDSLEVLKSEINVEDVNWTVGDSSTLDVTLDTTITDQLRAKGEMREIIRTVQDLRKDAGVAFDELVDIQLPSWPHEHEEEIKKRTMVQSITKGDNARMMRITSQKGV
ncbi:MAG TPA: DUF5915 domain-containing protein, partial [Patescibacteria group bacterium]|nr:DUF5915 domain-containing protein [Patescibacteria group bacterium]